MTRKENWPELLDEAIQKRYTAPFAWGEFDCCLFVCDCIEAMTGVDVAENFRGQYDSERTALKAIEYFFIGQNIKFSLRDMVRVIAESITDFYCMDEIEPAFAQRGDAVLLEFDGRQTLGIVGLDGRIAAPSLLGGLIFVPATAGLTAWRV